MAGKNSIAKAYVQILPSAEGLRDKLSGVFGREMPTAGSDAGGAFGSNLISKIKSVIVAAGIGKMISEAIQIGGAMEQSIGGIETLFKDSADAVIKNAEQAYKTAGMSANQYMETVTSFSASLLQGLGGDTAKAADIADMAMVDMSDNANKMGTDMEAIQNAYQGFAKQNYTMLDNLKLGYGGTKTEMQRLLADAQKLTGVEYDISNLSDVYSAIHVIQEEIGITGTTAKEASSTLSGSMASMKAAFSNVLANLSLGRDIGPSLKELGNTVFTFVRGNLLPMIGNILSALPSLLQEVLSMAIQGLNMIGDNAESIVQMGIDLVTGIGSAIITALPYLAESAWGIITALGSALINTDWLQIGSDVIGNLRSSLNLAAGEILGTDGNIVKSVLDSIATGLPDVIASGGEIINSLVDGIFGALPDLVDTALDLLTSFVGNLLNGLPEILETGKGMLLNLVDGIRRAFPDILESAGDAVMELLSGLVDKLPDILRAGFDLICELIRGIGNALPDIVSAAGRVAKKLWDGIKNIDWLQLGKDIIRGLINGIGSMASALWDAAKNIAKSALNAIKSFFGINSPSRVMRDEVGKFLPQGVAVGVKQNLNPISEAMHDMADLTTDSLGASLRLDTSKMAPVTENRYGETSIQISVYGSPGQNEEELARLVMEEIRFEIEKREAQLA
ncbi:MAG: hypothetical protein II272_03510 [Oscillospiraceae bacterium]|nr:hypothetical protein [Oscillospiraceae bacterium]